MENDAKKSQECQSALDELEERAKELDQRRTNNISVIRLVVCIALLVAWRSSNVMCSNNEVALRWARLVFRWINVCGQVNHLGT